MSTTCFGLPVERHDLRRASIQLSPFSLIATVTINLHAYSNPQETEAFTSGLLGTNPFAMTENDRCKRSATHQHCNVVFNTAILKSISAKQHCTESPQILDDTQLPSPPIPLPFFVSCLAGLCWHSRTWHHFFDSSRPVTASFDSYNTLPNFPPGTSNKNKNKHKNQHTQDTNGNGWMVPHAKLSVWFHLLVRVDSKSYSAVQEVTLKYNLQSTTTVSLQKHEKQPRKKRNNSNNKEQL